MIVFVGLIESHETSESEANNFLVMNIPKKPQTAMPSSFYIEVRRIRPFYFPHLRRSLVKGLYHSRLSHLSSKTDINLFSMSSYIGTGLVVHKDVQGMSSKTLITFELV